MSYDNQPETSDQQTMTERERNGLIAYGLLHSICIGVMAPLAEDISTLRYTKSKPYPAPDDPSTAIHRVTITVPATGEHIAIQTRRGADSDTNHPVTAVICNRELMASTPDEHEAEQTAVHNGDSFILASDGGFEDIFAILPDADVWLAHADETRDRVVLALSSCNFVLG